MKHKADGTGCYRCASVSGGQSSDQEALGKCVPSESVVANALAEAQRYETMMRSGSDMLRLRPKL
jgi:hypothetical protein